MPEKIVTAECSSCESSYEVMYMTELTSTELPEHCPFCGEPIDDLTEEYIDDIDSDNDDDGRYD